MNVASLDDLIGALRESGLFDDEQLAELNDLAARFPNPQALTRELERRGWLTAYQAQELLAGRGRELVFGQYVVLSLLGEGGMGKVLKARHRLMKRVVALKIIRPTLLAQPRAVERFHREIEAVARLAHPNIVAAYDADQVGGTHFLVMEYVDGTDLARLVKRHGPLSAGMASECIRQAALGLEHAFAQGLVHRDIKPHNLLLSRGQPPVVKILDMGLARLQVGEGDGLTHTGAVMGTPDFIAPEQASDSHKVDIRADLYSLGCTLYFLLCGEAPFPGGTALEKLFKHQYVAPRPIELRRPDVPPDVAAVVAKLMAKRPEERYQTPAELVAALTPLAGDESLLAETLLHLGSVADDDEPFGTMRPAGPAADTMEPQAAATRTDEPPEQSGDASARSPGDWSAKPVPYVAPGPPPAPSGPKAPPRPAPARRVPLMIALVLAGAVVAAPGAVALWMMLHPPDQTGLANVVPTEGGPLPTSGASNPSGREDTAPLATERSTPKDTKPVEATPKQTPHTSTEPSKPLPPPHLRAGVIRSLDDWELVGAALAAGGRSAVLNTKGTQLFYADALDRDPPAPLDGYPYGGIGVASAVTISPSGSPVFFSALPYPADNPKGMKALRLWRGPGTADKPYLAGEAIQEIRCLAVSGKGNRVLAGTAGSRDGKQCGVYLWELTNGQAVFRAAFSGHKQAEGVLSIAISEDGKHAVSVAAFDRVRWWNVGDKAPDKDVGSRRVEAYDTSVVAMSPSGSRILYADGAGALHLIPIASWEKETAPDQDMTLRGPEGRITALAFASADYGRDMPLAVSGSEGGDVTLWDLQTREPLPLGAHRGRVLAVALSFDRKYVYSIGIDRKICRWHTPEAKKPVPP
jgi:serine/threonine protein kinase